MEKIPEGMDDDDAAEAEEDDDEDVVVVRCFPRQCFVCKACVLKER